MIHEQNENVHTIKRRNMTPVVLIAGAALAIITLLLSGYPNKERAGVAANQHLNNEGHNAAMSDGITEKGEAMNAGSDWKEIHPNMPAQTLAEIGEGSGIDVRGAEGYTVYGIGEETLFETDKATLRPEAAASLQRVAASITQRFNQGDVRVYGYTDAQGSAGYNKQLAQQRAEAVRNWLVQNSSIEPGRISLQAIGEAKPVADNATAQGRQQNRRVEIMARNKGVVDGKTLGGQLAEQAAKNGQQGTQKGNQDGGTDGSRNANEPANNASAPVKSAAGPY